MAHPTIETEGAKLARNAAKTAAEKEKAKAAFVGLAPGASRHLVAKRSIKSFENSAPRSSSHFT
jgi:hypothetical protein